MGKRLIAGDGLFTNDYTDVPTDEVFKVLQKSGIFSNEEIEKRVHRSKKVFVEVFTGEDHFHRRGRNPRSSQPKFDVPPAPRPLPQLEGSVAAGEELGNSPTPRLLPH